jgi:hypothetical protein
MSLERSTFLHATKEIQILSDQNKVIQDLTLILGDFLPSFFKKQKACYAKIKFTKSGRFRSIDIWKCNEDKLNYCCSFSSAVILF